MQTIKQEGEKLLGIVLLIAKELRGKMAHFGLNGMQKQGL